jgi:AcrR family transcriptional regulator
MKQPRFTAPLLDAAAEVLADGGLSRMSLERVAVAAETSRVTLWRQGVTAEGLVEALLERVAEDCRARLWPVLTGPMPAATRLRDALFALCEVADGHLAVLQVDDELFHVADAAAPGVFVEPLERLLRDGAADGSIPPGDRDPEEFAMTLFNVLIWPYVHLRARHGWTSERSSENVIDLMLDGVLEGASTT